MSLVRRFTILAALLLAACGDQKTEAPSITDMTMFRGDFATVNSFVFSNGKSLLVLDVQRKPKEANQLVDVIKAMNLPLEYILISHGHTDHFTGMAIVSDAFPEAEIVVATQEIKDDIKAYAAYMHSGGETGAEPALDKSIWPKTEDYPEGWDYDANIKVLNADTITLTGGGTLQLETDYLPNEADHMMTVYSEDLNALFMADLGYTQTHFWLGDDISWSDVANWRVELLKMQEKYAPIDPVVYPGHGEPTNIAAIDDMVGYIDAYTEVTQNAATQKQAYDEMVARFPDYGEADFFLFYSLQNHMRDKPVE